MVVASDGAEAAEEGAGGQCYNQRQLGVLTPQLGPTRKT